MIRIGKIECCSANGRSRVEAKISIENAIYPLWVEVAEEYSDALCATRSDAFVVGLLKYAIQTKQDISFETPMTWQLKPASH